MNTVPYSRTLRLNAVGGETLRFEMPAPVAGVLNRLVLRQVSGALEGFTLDLYTSETPSGDDTDDYSEVDDDAGSAVSFQVLPTQTVAALSQVLALYEKNYGYMVNELAGEGRRKSALFAKLVVSGSGVKPFDLSYLIFGYNPF